MKPLYNASQPQPAAACELYNRVAFEASENMKNASALKLFSQNEKCLQARNFSSQTQN
jgi:hypothetical protein